MNKSFYLQSLSYIGPASRKNKMFKSRRGSKQNRSYISIDCIRDLGACS